MPTVVPGILADQIKAVSKTALPPSLAGYAQMWSVGVAGPLYDIYFVETLGGPRTIAFMKLYFRFSSEGKEGWPDRSEAIAFARRWQADIQKKFNVKSLTTTPSGRIVGLEFHFAQGLFSFDPGDHWLIDVVKVPQGQFYSSQVKRAHGTTIGHTTLSSNDLAPITRQKDGHPYKQRPAIHEFAHMIDLRDEYLDICDANGLRADGLKCNAVPRDPRYIKDYPSVANSGEQIRPRHLETIKNWTAMAAPLSPLELGRPSFKDTFDALLFLKEAPRNTLKPPLKLAGVL
ncbi:hypothetical protein [Labrys sp. ZIDIC5]|uniref:hypothetical protein n=1 Tax=Labrys sedimenti TaxID=3106036 RepID=UPI002ACAF625|nr:hypothetical protein [Labrys sp. ZIDIC5]MDZ5453984.1 hypothetical protein [Labrys sp. ZIDIC5]